MKQAHILIVDDEVAMLHSVKRVLSSGYTVDTASNAEEALEALRAQPPDLAILDIRMPVLDGFGLLSLLRAEQPDLEVIFMTGAVHEIDSQLIRAIREKAFYFVQKPFDREVLLTLVERCLELRRLTEENRAHVATLEAELAAARAFQRSMLPAPGLSLGSLELASRYEPCDSLGGDLVDYVDAGEGRATLLVADVSGHGVSAAMLTGIVKSGFHDAHVDSFEPMSVVQRVAAALRPFELDRFVTLFCARLDPVRGELEYVNAGHPAPFMWGVSGQRGSLRRLEVTGPLISPAFPDFTWEGKRIELSAGDALLAYSDGVTEARDGERFFGEEGLAAVLEGGTPPGRELLDEIARRVEEFTEGRPADDDRTLALAVFEGG